MNFFEDKKRQLENLEAPNELEARLTNALKKQPKKRIKMPSYFIAAAAVLLLLLVSFNINGVAYYGKRLFGYENLMSNTLKKLNTEGLGQSVNKSMTLKNGTIISIEGIVSDTNQLIVYYKETHPTQPIKEAISFSQLEGFLTDATYTSGTYEPSEDGQQLTGIAIFESVSPFSKKLTLSFSDESNQYTMEIPYHADDAIPVTLKRSVNQTFSTDIGKIKVNKITATGASTVIEGKFNKNIDRYLNTTLDIHLYADGQKIPWQQSGMSSTLFSGSSFDITYEALPPNTKKLEMRLEEFNAYDKVNAIIGIEKGASYDIGNKQLRIIDYKVGEKETLVTIASERNITFDNVSLKTASESAGLKTTINQQDVAEEFVRTLVFETTSQPLELYIEGVYSIKMYNKSIEIPLK
ncbi:DUF4179 domain-containing protein [Solibacillus sp. FSL R7-0682]|uniref:DUF4179 domain-containing protein n=1 Tax=Solibacillus sp. FSL R7-0682 TaxID=2921690 RepID=UPI0030FCB6C4